MQLTYMHTEPVHQQMNLHELNFMALNSLRNHFCLNIRCFLLQIENILLNLRMLRFRSCSFKCYETTIQWRGSSCTCKPEYLHWFCMHKLFFDKMQKVLGRDCSYLHG